MNALVLFAALDIPAGLSTLCILDSSSGSTVGLCAAIL
jgi:hypothetical protein